MQKARREQCQLDQIDKHNSQRCYYCCICFGCKSDYIAGDVMSVGSASTNTVPESVGAAIIIEMIASFRDDKTTSRLEQGRRPSSELNEASAEKRKRQTKRDSSCHMYTASRLPSPQAASSVYLWLMRLTTDGRAARQLDDDRMTTGMGATIVLTLLLMLETRQAFDTAFCY